MHTYNRSTRGDRPGNGGRCPQDTLSRLRLAGDRSDKIRTYNYPQNRVTDHRINLTLYNLDRIVLGDLDPIIDALKLAENTERLKELSSEEVGN